MTEPNWIEVTAYGSDFDIELDVNAAPDSPQQYKHRLHSFSGHALDNWVYGKPKTEPYTDSIGAAKMAFTATPNYTDRESMDDARAILKTINETPSHDQSRDQLAAFLRQIVEREIIKGVIL